MSVALFAGPTANGLADPGRALGVEWFPPVRRGDIARLIESRAVRDIAIVDGTFHSYPAVGHAELMNALQSGCRIWGLSSMGAIRAAEMSLFGMRGFGRVYEMFASDAEFSDDEVTLVHEAEAPWRPLSEPLVHIRACLAELTDDGLLSEESCRVISAAMKERWYGHRTLGSLRELLARHCRAPVAIENTLKNFARFRIKSADLRDFLALRPWESA